MVDLKKRSTRSFRDQNSKILAFEKLISQKSFEVKITDCDRRPVEKFSDIRHKFVKMPHFVLTLSLLNARPPILKLVTAYASGSSIRFAVSSE